MAWVPANHRKLAEVRDRLGENKLGTLLAAGQLQAFEVDGLGIMDAIPPEIWRTSKAKQIMRTGYTERPARPGGSSPRRRVVLIKMPDEVLRGETDTAPDQSQVASEKPERRQGGRPPADWDAVFIAAACIAVTDGLPTTQNAFIDAIQTRLGDGAPSDTQMKTRIGPLFRELRKALSQSET